MDKDKSMIVSGKVRNKHKGLVIFLAVAFVMASIYSGILIYQNNHKVTKLKPGSIRSINLADQYYKGGALPPKTSSQVIKNDQSSVILSFYKDYLANKHASKNQAATLSKYGTDNLASANKTSGKVDQITCGTDNLNEATIEVGDSVQVTGQTAYPITFRSNKGQVIVIPQVSVVSQNNKYLIDKVSCPGPV